MLSDAFMQALAPQRGALNARVAQAVTRDPSFDADAFGRFLQDCIDPLIVAVAAHASNRVGPVADAAFDMSLGLAGSGAATRTLAGTVCTGLGRRYATLVAAHPRETLAMLVNAAAYVHGIPGALGAQWMARMAALAPQIASLAQLRAVGQILAWRAGAAHFRTGAIAAADALPESLAVAAFGARGSWTALRQQLEGEPYWRAPDDGSAQAVRDTGAFTGLGGVFPAPPTVRACDDGFMVASGDRHFLLVADGYGAVLHRAARAEYDAAAGCRFPAAFALADATLVIGVRRLPLDLPADGLAACCNASAVAVTSPYTHAIRVAPLR